jgi:hypothetical protein
MRRLYVLAKDIWSGAVQTGMRAMPDGPDEPVLLPMAQLFHPAIGSHYIDLAGGLVLMMTSFDHDERSEDLFHAHPAVAILPHPSVDGNKPLKNHIGAAGYKFAQHHLEALTAHPHLGIIETDSVLDVARKASAIHPEVKFRNAL